MSQRAGRLQAKADAQIAELLNLVESFDITTLRLPCPGREKLGDGSVGALAQHTADNYRRIATFLTVAERANARSGHLAGRFFRGRGPAIHGDHRHGPAYDDRRYTAAAVDLAALTEQLSHARETLLRIADLSDSEFDAIPPDGSFRFCDGQRNLDQVLTALLTHQGHQVVAIRAAIPA